MDDAEKLIQSAGVNGSGAVAQGQNAKSVGENGIMIEGGMSGNLFTGAKIEKIEIITENMKKNDLPFSEALEQYLGHIITTHQYLQLRGIPVGNKSPLVSLERVYISLTVSEPENELGRDPELPLAAALQRYQRLVILGDPGCGKTTLISYLGLTYARTLSEGVNLVNERLNLDEAGYLPIILPLRDIGRYLEKNEHSQPSMDGSKLLLEYVREYYQARDILLPEKFFSLYLENKNVVLLLDGMDEVVEPSLRRRVSRLIDEFAARYSECRFVVTSRKIGYEGSCRLEADFGLAQVRNFTPPEVRQFVKDWTRSVEVTLAGNESPETLSIVNNQAENLIHEIESNSHVVDLVVNPLLLTVVFIVYRHHLKINGMANLPERRYDLYAQAVEILLAHWDQAKGVENSGVIGKYELDVDDRRNLLESVAFWMHEQNKREIERDDLNAVLLPRLESITKDHSTARKLLDSFIALINMRSGLLVDRGKGIYGFAHLTFQEYLAARALAEHTDATGFTLQHLHEDRWREIILLEASYLSTMGKHRVSELIRSIKDAKSKKENDPSYNLFLAAECLNGIGNQEVEGDLLGEICKELKTQADAPIQKNNKQSVMAKINANNYLARIDNGQITTHLWKFPHGEPEWITISPGDTWIGSEDGEDIEKPTHKIYLPAYQISRIPITNAQYAYYIKDTEVKAPSHWHGVEIPIGLEDHPVVNVSWFDAKAYCQWLSKKINQNVTMPSEVEWEKAARGDILVYNSKDNKNLEYPWGAWQEWRCNSEEFGLEEKTTTKVDQFINGASPYKLLDLSGNIWEWTRSAYKDYPYNPNDGREDLQLSNPRIRRGGCFRKPSYFVRYTYRGWYFANNSDDDLGFRVVLVSS